MVGLPTHAVPSSPLHPSFGTSAVSVKKNFPFIWGIRFKASKFVLPNTSAYSISLGRRPSQKDTDEESEVESMRPRKNPGGHNRRFNLLFYRQDFVFLLSIEIVHTRCYYLSIGWPGFKSKINNINFGTTCTFFLFYLIYLNSPVQISIYFQAFFIYHEDALKENNIYIKNHNIFL